MSIRNYLIIKSAGTVGRILRGGAGVAGAGMLAGPKGTIAAGAASGLGDLAGNFSDADMEELAAAYKDWGKDFIPGVASYRMSRQRNAIENMLKKKRGKRGGGSKTLSESLGTHTSAILPAILGGVLGGRKSKFKNSKDIENGIRRAGSLVGLANAGATLGSAVTKGRSKEDLDDYYNGGIGSTLANYLVPGSATYNRIKNQFAGDRLIEEYMEDPEGVEQFLNDTDTDADYGDNEE